MDQQPRRVRTASSLAAALAVAAALAAALLATPAAAHWDSGQYTHSSCAGAWWSRVDPVNVVFWDVGTWDRAANHIVAHAGWTNQEGSGQYFFDHGNCHYMTTQRASGRFTRSHIRLHPIHHDWEHGWTTVGDAHHEDFVWYCGHAVDAKGPGGSGFDQGRNELVWRLSAGGHAYYYAWWGNTQNFRQCDGDYAGSDGWSASIHIGWAYH